VGRLTQNTDRAGQTQLFDRVSSEEDFTVTRTTALGRTWSYAVQRDRNNIQSQQNTAADGTESSLAYDPRVTSDILTMANGTQRAEKQDPDSRFGMLAPIVAELILTRPSTDAVTITRSKLTELADPKDPLSLVSQTFAETIDGNSTVGVYTAVDRTFVTTSEEGRSNAVSLDALGREIQRQEGGLHPLTTAYDSRGFLESLTFGVVPDARIYSFVYNAQGYLESITDSLGRSKTFAYDAAGRVISTVLPDGRSLSHDYDENGNRTSIRPPDRPTYTLS
jgi:YD repeat-containing protein